MDMYIYTYIYVIYMPTCQSMFSRKFLMPLSISGSPVNIPSPSDPCI